MYDLQFLIIIKKGNNTILKEFDFLDCIFQVQILQRILKIAIFNASNQISQSKYFQRIKCTP